MKNLLNAFLFFFITIGFSQEQHVHSIYFETDVREIKQLQSDAVVYFLKLIDTTRIDNISIFGYCDDVGKADYNFKLSEDRANSVKNMLVKKGIKYKIIVKIEGKGKVMIDEDLEENIPEARSKNRRVDVVLNFKPMMVEELNIPGLYPTIRKNAQVGDRVYLEKLLFDSGSSKLKESAQKELEKMVVLLKRYPTLSIEVQGHVCCTPTFHKEAIDKDSRKRELSKNRAERVYKFLISRGIKKERLTFKGYGNTQPLNKGSEYDRRVELVVTKN